MIARLTGTLIRDNDQVIVECAGVGYEVLCSAYTIAALPTAGEAVTLRVFTHMRETALVLYGFADPCERALFDLLITVKNVGPSTAIAILSGASPRDIAGLIARQDVAGLVRIRGIGKKTAELLVVELHEKCQTMLLTWNAAGQIREVATPAGARPPKPTAGRHPLLDDVTAALVGMGWRPAEADAAVKDLDLARTEVTVEQLLVEALRSMPR